MVLPKSSSMHVYKALQDKVTEREPFNDAAINFRQKEDIADLVGSICKGLEIIDGVELLYTKINDQRDQIYEWKKTKSELTKEELNELNEKARKNKNAQKSIDSPYPLTSITDSRLLDIEIKMRYTNKGESEEVVYHFNYPELVDGEYFLLEGKKFFPIFQLADAEYYRSGHNSIVLKNTFMPITVKGISGSKLYDELEEIALPAKLFELYLFKKRINVYLYYFAKFGVNETLEIFKLKDFVTIHNEPFNPKEYNEEEFHFKLSNKMYLSVNKQWLDDDQKRRASLIYTLIKALPSRIGNPANIYDETYWMKVLGRIFTNNSTKVVERAHSSINSIERLLDNTTKKNMRCSEEEKKDVYAAIYQMVYNFDSIIRIDNYDLSNKRIRVAEYILYPLTARLSQSVYRLISSRNPPISKLKQIFSSIDPNFIVSGVHSIKLINFNNQVNTLDLFSKKLKGSKDGPQSQSNDNSGLSIGVRGFDSSYLGLISVVSTSSNEPGISFTITPFCDVYDPNNNNNFYFTEKPQIQRLIDSDEEYDEEELEDVYDEETDYEAIMSDNNLEEVE